MPGIRPDGGALVGPLLGWGLHVVRGAGPGRGRVSCRGGGVRLRRWCRCGVRCIRGLGCPALPSSCIPAAFRLVLGVRSAARVVAAALRLAYSLTGPLPSVFNRFGWAPTTVLERVAGRSSDQVTIRRSGGASQAQNTRCSGACRDRIATCCYGRLHRLSVLFHVRAALVHARGPVVRLASTGRPPVVHGPFGASVFEQAFGWRGGAPRRGAPPSAVRPSNVGRSGAERGDRRASW